MKLLPACLLVGALLSLSNPTTAQTTKKPAAGGAPKTAAKPAAKPAATAKPATVTATPPPKPASAHSEAGSGQRAAASGSSSSSSGGMGMSAGNSQFGVGNTAVNLGIGLVNFGSYSGLSFAGSGVTRTPLINLSVEHGLMELGPGVLSIGGVVGYRRASYTYDGLYGYKWSATDLFVGVRGIYHYQLTPQLDTYGGLTVGLWHSSYSWKWNDGTPVDFRIGGRDSWTRAGSGLFVGARYYFTDNIGAFGEFGYDLSLVKVGLSAKF